MQLPISIRAALEYLREHSRECADADDPDTYSGAFEHLARMIEVELSDRTHLVWEGPEDLAMFMLKYRGISAAQIAESKNFPEWKAFAQAILDGRK